MDSDVEGATQELQVEGLTTTRKPTTVLMSAIVFYGVSFERSSPRGDASIGRRTASAGPLIDHLGARLPADRSQTQPSEEYRPRHPPRESRAWGASDCLTMSREARKPHLRDAADRAMGSSAALFRCLRQIGDYRHGIC